MNLYLNPETTLCSINLTINGFLVVKNPHLGHANRLFASTMAICPAQASGVICFSAAGMLSLHREFALQDAM